MRPYTALVSYTYCVELYQVNYCTPCPVMYEIECRLEYTTLWPVPSSCHLEVVGTLFIYSSPGTGIHPILFLFKKSVNFRD